MARPRAKRRERGPPFSYKKSGQPTSAGRCISSEYVDYGWSVQLTREQNQIADKTTQESNGMYALQVSRDRPIESFSMRSAIFWEHRKLPDQRIVSTPSTDIFGFFTKDEEICSMSIRDISRQYSEDQESIKVHVLFEAMREREFMVWPVDIDGVWVLLVIRFQETRARKVGDSFADREVTDLMIVDSLAEGRKGRMRLIGQRLPMVMIHGCIATREGIKLHDIKVRDVQHEWETGYVTYAVAREFMRRLSVLTWRRQAMDDYDHDFVWNRFEEYYNFDAYRQHMMTACAHDCIEKAHYQVRMALEVPSNGSAYYPSDLSHIDAPSVTDPPEEVPDEIFSYFIPKGEKQRSVVVHLTKGSQQRAQYEEQQQSPQYDAQHNVGEEDNRSQNEDSDADAPDDGIPDEPIRAPGRFSQDIPLEALNIRQTPEATDQYAPENDEPQQPKSIRTLPSLRLQRALGAPNPGNIAVNDTTTHASTPQILPLLETAGDPNEQYVKGKTVITITDSESSPDDYTTPAVPIALMEPASFANAYAGMPGIGSLNTAQPGANMGPGFPTPTFQGPQSEGYLTQFSLSGSQGGSAGFWPSAGTTQHFGAGESSESGFGNRSNKRGPSGGGQSTSKRPRYGDYL